MLTPQKIQKYEKLLRKLRQHIFNHYDQSEQKRLKTQKLITKCKSILIPHWEQQNYQRNTKYTDRIMHL